MGDSGAIIDRGGTAYRLTEDHKPYMKGERQRIQEAGGQLVENGNRVLSNAKDDGRASMLAMSRYACLTVQYYQDLRLELLCWLPYHRIHSAHVLHGSYVMVIILLCSISAGCV